MMISSEFLSIVTTALDEAAILDRVAGVWLTTGVVPVAHIVADADDAESCMPAPEAGAPAPSATMVPAASQRRRPVKGLARWWAVSHGVADRAHRAWR